MVSPSWMVSPGPIRPSSFVSPLIQVPLHAQAAKGDALCEVSEDNFGSLTVQRIYGMEMVIGFLWWSLEYWSC